MYKYIDTAGTYVFTDCLDNENTFNLSNIQSKHLHFYLFSEYGTERTK